MTRAALRLAFAMILATSAALAEEIGDAERGAKLFSQQCKACHQIGDGAVNRVGPHLNGVFGRKAGAIGGFNYSKSMAPMGAGRLLNRWGPRTLILPGFGHLALGYALCRLTGLGLWFFLLATMPVGLGVGIVVGGALRSIAIDEAPPTQRGAAQGLVNICTSIGTLLSAAVVSAVADFGGGGARGFAMAYLGVAALMLAMLLATLRLRAHNAAAPQPAQERARA